MTTDKDEIKTKLTEEEYRVTQEKGTERPFHNAYFDNHETGMYDCKVCGAHLFDSTRKYDSGTGWPSFDEAIPGSVKYEKDMELGMERTEIVCGNCGAHLGHVFDDGPKGPMDDGRIGSGKRFCTNSASLSFKPGQK